MPGVGVTREQVQAWLDAYVDAWRTYEASTIGALFSADATYAYHPHDEPERGREAIVASWLSEPDEARSWEAGYAPLVIDGDRAVAAGETVYGGALLLVAQCGEDWRARWRTGRDDR